MRELDAIGIELEAGDTTDVVLPHEYTPREYQREVWTKLFEEDCKRVILCWHRRAGKDITLLNTMVAKAMERVGQYFYFFPTAVMARRAVWDGISATGFKYLDHIPESIVDKVNNTEMKVTLLNGSILQLLGVDTNVDVVVGTNPVGCLFSEYSVSVGMQQAWDLVRPILAENGGFALFAYTPRGRNHGFQLFDAASKTESWFTQLLTVDDTRRPDGTRVITQEAIDDEIAAGMPTELVESEFFCSWEGSVQGAYYTSQLKKAYEDHRVGKIPVEQTLDVCTAWDLGIGDATSIWLFQEHAKEIRLVGYYENSGEGLTHYINWLKDWASEYDVRLGRHIAPHDIEVRELTSGRSRKETALEMGIRFETAPKLPIDEGIDMVRRIFPRCWFDEERTAKGLSALAEYTKDFDSKTQTFKSHPRHDWTSHAADALRTLAVTYRGHQRERQAAMQAGPRPKAKEWSVF